MTTLKTRKVFAAAACSLALLGVAACGTEDTTAAAPSKESSSAAPSEASMDATSDLVGPGCADYAKAVPDGAGSVDGMAQDKVATAASNNPLLKTLVAAASSSQDSPPVPRMRSARWRSQQCCDVPASGLPTSARTFPSAAGSRQSTRSTPMPS